MSLRLECLFCCPQPGLGEGDVGQGGSWWSSRCLGHCCSLSMSIPWDSCRRAFLLCQAPHSFCSSLCFHWPGAAVCHASERCWVDQHTGQPYSVPLSWKPSLIMVSLLGVLKTFLCKHSPLFARGLVCFSPDSYHSFIEGEIQALLDFLLSLICDCA